MFRTCPLRTASLLFSIILASTPAFATSSGLDTPSGVLVLPFSVQGVEMMDLTGTGLGIGTIAPAAMLDISSANASTYMNLSNIAAGGHVWSLYSSGGGPAAAGSFGIYDMTAGASRFVIDASGNVGIGSTTPGHALDVIAGALPIAVYGTSSWNVGWGAYFHNNDSGGNRYVELAGGAYSGIFMNGNVGIGTLSPLGNLDVESTTSPGNATICLNGNCMTSVPGPVRYYTNSVNFSGSIGSYAAYCPAGTHAVSGGGYCGGGGPTATMVGSFPLNGGGAATGGATATGWIVYCYPNGSGSITVYVGCQ